MSSSTLPQVAAPSLFFGEEPPAGGAHAKAFRSLSNLMRDIAECRAEISRQEAAVEELQARFQKEALPLEKLMVNIRVETFRVLGRHLKEGKSLKKKMRHILESALENLALELEDEFGVDMEADWKAVFGESRKDSGLEDFFEEDPFGDDVPESDEPSARQGRRNADPDSEEGIGKGRRGRKRKAPTGEGVKREAQEQALAGDIRALYLMLARALHPDKEADPGRQLEKTTWMQKVTAAYANRNLAQLLDILARNPLDAVGPYLSQAPLKTVQGFTKRLRRELTALRHQALRGPLEFNPHFARFIREGRVDNRAFLRYMNEGRKELKAMQQHLDRVKTPEGLAELIEMLLAEESELPF